MADATKYNRNKESVSSPGMEESGKTWTPLLINLLELNDAGQTFGKAGGRPRSYWATEGRPTVTATSFYYRPDGLLERKEQEDDTWSI